jgi:TonB family protein
MDRRLKALAAAAVLWAGLGGQALASMDAPKLAPEATITNPDWIRKPGPDEFADYYPKVAWLFGLGGTVVITCKVSPDGGLTGCSTSEEAPAGFGFADAALQISRFFQMKPKTVDGKPVEGGSFSTRIRFSVPEGVLSGSELPPAPSAAPPSASALALGRRLAAAFNVRPALSAYIDAYLQRLKAQAKSWASESGEQATTQFEQEVATVGEKAKSNAAAATESMAVYFAQTYSEDDLTAIIAFEESPAGHALQAHQQDTNLVYASAVRQVLVQAILSERERLCATYRCAASSPPPK